MSRNRGVLAIALSWTAVGTGPAPADVIYDSHGFEGFEVGPIDGQDGWHGWEADGGQGAIVLPGPPAMGERAVRLEIFFSEGAVTEMWREFDDLLAQGYTRVVVAFDIYRPQPQADWFPDLWWYFSGAGNLRFGAQLNEGLSNTSHTYPVFDFEEGGSPWVDTAVERWARVEVEFRFDEGIASGRYDGIFVGEETIDNFLSFNYWDFTLSHGEAPDQYTFENAWIDNFIMTGDKGECYPDCDANGALDLFDFLCFVNQFNAGADYSDCDGNGALDLFDFLCFVNAFNAGC